VEIGKVFLLSVAHGFGLFCGFIIQPHEVENPVEYNAGHLIGERSTEAHGVLLHYILGNQDVCIHHIALQVAECDDVCVVVVAEELNVDPLDVVFIAESVVNPPSQ